MTLARDVAFLIGSILLVLATSLDGFSAGVAYGFRRIRLPFWSRVVVAAVSVLTLSLAMLLGRAVGGSIPGRWARMAGGIALIVIGLWSAARGLISGSRVPDLGRVWTWRVPSLGLVIQIMREPVSADFDASGAISAFEALWLGYALAVDALGAGFCATLGAGMPFFLPLAVGLVNWVFLTAGVAVGGLIGSERFPAMAALPGLVLVVLGFMRVF